MGINLTCPRCGQQMHFSLQHVEVRCPECGYVRSTGLDEKAAEVRARGQRPAVRLTHSGEIHPRALSLFYTGHDHLFADDRAAALAAFERALEVQPDFVDAHLWIAKTSQDAGRQRDHLSTILAHNPGHAEAIRLLMVLNGRLTPEQAARADRADAPLRLVTPEPVTAEAAALLCPVCRGHLTVWEADGRVECRFCGYTGPQPGTASGAGDTLTAALLERKAQPVQWLVGERVLHCQECGAERTLTAAQLSTRCPFCGSIHVIQQDALGSFTQPEALIPFKVTRAQAAAAIKERLRGLPERLKGLLNNNRVSRATLEGYYLPFWVFDALVEVSRTQIVNQPSSSRIQRPPPAYARSTFQDAQYDVEVCAVESPPPHLTDQLGDYHLRDAVDYQPALLAEYPAQIYSLDFDQAALKARGLVANAMRTRYTRRELSDDRVSIHVFTQVLQMSFRLVLAPVWVALLVERDGDLRPALVNGQTGKVVLGRAQKPGMKRRGGAG